MSPVMHHTASSTSVRTKFLLVTTRKRLTIHEPKERATLVPEATSIGAPTRAVIIARTHAPHVEKSGWTATEV